MADDDRHPPDLAPGAEVLVDAMDRIVARSEGRVARGLPTGFVDLDEVTGGLHPGHLIVLAGRPAMGKTSLALGICEHLLCDQGKAVLHVSLQSSRVALMQQLLGTRSEVDGYKVRTGQGMREDDLARLGRAYNELHRALLWIATPPVPTTARIAAGARWLKEHRSLDLVVVDDLESVEPVDARLSRPVRLGTIALNLQDLARELDVPVLALANAGRGVERRSDHRPRVRDVAGSMAVAGVADVVLLLHRPEYYDPNGEPGLAEVIVAKNEAGPMDTIHLKFQRNLTRFTDFREDPGPEDPDAVPF